MTGQIASFIAANDRSPVVEGNVRNGGAIFHLKSGIVFLLTPDERRALPEGYPKWDLPKN
ncbi:hypothetical protein [Hyphomicrobium sp. 2TAF46]|uniref:hypothetical protein n=1 Tax=Hyphomicrobium sp. 2TAF46 TaxID=3233019 RepID=UPI003F8DE6D5